MEISKGACWEDEPHGTPFRSSERRTRNSWSHYLQKASTKWGLSRFIDPHRIVSNPEGLAQVTLGFGRQALGQDCHQTYLRFFRPDCSTFGWIQLPTLSIYKRSTSGYSTIKLPCSYLEAKGPFKYKASVTAVRLRAELNRKTYARAGWKFWQLVLPRHDSLLLYHCYRKANRV
jgi:hypothetical protein